MFRRADPSIGSTDFKSHRERATRRGNERIRIAEAYLAEEMSEVEAVDAAARAAAHEEAIRARILKKRQRRNTRALAREQNRAVREMAGLPPKEEKEASGGEDSSGYE
ncbi:Pyrophosphate-energized vacuolar membrane proton pump [Hordeum vulgare]|nr:Pyrophosphate-energized vacuolar membrane proton pump [Hordeum vulgare]